MESVMTAIIVIGIVVACLFIGHCVFTILCDTISPFAEWSRKGAEEMEQYQRKSTDYGDGYEYLFIEYEEVEEDDEA